MNATISFDAPVKEFAQAFNIQFGVVVKTITLDLFRRVTLRTPVDTGRARAGWQIGVGEPGDMLPEKTEGLKPRKKNQRQPRNKEAGPKAKNGTTFTTLFGGGTTDADLSKAAHIDGGELIYITNNLPYIERLEFGHSKQAPAGMVRLSVAEVAAEIELMLEAKLKQS